jgi:hypothetical protein
VLIMVFVDCLVVLRSGGDQQVENAGDNRQNSGHRPDELAAGVEPGEQPTQGSLKAEQQESQSEEQQSGPPAVQIGETLAMGEVSWRVTKAQQASELGSHSGMVLKGARS